METEKKYGPQWVKSPIKLTIGILVSNNIKTIRRCLDSLQPILKAVKSELIIVDTVGEEQSDGSLAIAKEYTDKVYHFDWCNDFAAARNICLDNANGEWFLYVDDDEWFDDAKEIIEFFNSEDCDKYFQGVYQIRNYDADGNYTVATVSRLFRRTASMRFVGKVHETVTEAYLPKKMISVVAGHSGYAFQTDEERQKKQQRNIGILEQEIKEEGLDSSRAAQMVQELLSRPKTAAAGFEQCLKYIGKLAPTGQLNLPSGQWLLLASARYFSIVKNYEELFYQAEWLRKNFRLSQTAELALAVTVIFPAVEKDRMDLVEQYAKIYFKSWDWIKSHEEDALLQLQLDFAAFLDEGYYQKIIYIAAVTANYNNKYYLANEYLMRLPWQQEDFKCGRFAKILEQTLEGLKKI